jgi:lambda family phage tail tape measure protein
MAANMDALLKITAQVDGANNIVSLNRGLQSVEGTAKGVTTAMRGMTGAASGLSGALGALAPLLSVAGLVGLAKGALDAGDRMNDLAQSTGVSVESLAKFKKAAATSGTDIDGVAKALVKLSKGMLEANAGNKQASAAFKALGVSITDSKGNLKTSDDVMLQVANRFKAMPDGVAKTALSLKLFGKAGAEMIPMLNMGGDAIEKLGSKMTTAFARKADEYKDKLAMLSMNVGALGQDLFLTLLPALTAVTDAVSNAVQGFNNLPGPIKALATAGALLAIAWGPIGGLIKGAQVAFIAGTAAIEAFQVQLSLAAMEGIPAFEAAIMSVPVAGWAIAAAAAVVALGVAAYNLAPPFRAFIDEFPQRFARFAQELGQGFVDTFAAIAKSWGQLVGFIGNTLSPLQGAMKGAADFVRNAWRSAFGDIQIDWKKTVEFMLNATNPLYLALKGISGGRIDIAKATTNLLFNPAPKTGAQKPAAPPPGFTPDLAGLNTDSKSEADKAARLAAEREKLRLELMASQGQFAYLKKQQEINDLILQENDLRARGLVTAATATHLKTLDKQEKLEELKIETDLQKKLAEARKEMDPASRLLKEQIALTDSIVKKAELRVKLEQDQKMEVQATNRAIKQRQQDEARSLTDITNRSKYAYIGATQGSQAEQRQREMDGLVQKRKDAEGLGNTNEVKALDDQIRALTRSYAEMDKLANSAAFGFKSGITAYLEGIGSLADSVKNVTKNVLQNLEDKLVEFVATGKASFQDFANYVIQQLLRIVIQQTIMKPILQGLSSLFPSIFPKGNANGNVFAANGIVPYAMGGIVDRPTLFPFAKGIGLMGEAGPEAIMPLKRGADGKLGVAGGGRGGTTVNVSVDAKGTSVQGDGGNSAALGRAIAASVQQELIKQKRPGGLLA